MVEISDNDYRIIRDKLPLVMKHCKVSAADIRTLNAVRQLALLVQKFRKPLRAPRR